MSTDTIFGNDGKEVTPPVQQTQTNTDPYANLLGMILNERGEQKYKTIEEALKGAAHAQTYIGQQAQERRELEARLAEASAKQSRERELEETLNKLMSQRDTSSSQSQTQTSAPVPDDIAAMVLKQLDARKDQEIAAQNQKSVAESFVSKYGAEAEARYNAAAQELGISVSDLNSMAAKSPKAVLKALGVEGAPASKPHNISPLPSAINTSGFEPKQESMVRRNSEQAKLGSTTRDLIAESNRAKQMVEELMNNNMSTADLVDPKNFFKYFSN